MSSAAPIPRATTTSPSRTSLSSANSPSDTPTSLTRLSMSALTPEKTGASAIAKMEPISPTHALSAVLQNTSIAPQSETPTHRDNVDEHPVAQFQSSIVSPTTNENVDPNHIDVSHDGGDDNDDSDDNDDNDDDGRMENIKVVSKPELPAPTSDSVSQHNEEIRQKYEPLGDQGLTNNSEEGRPRYFLMRCDPDTDIQSLWEKNLWPTSSLYHDKLQEAYA
ncbi:hypothetical protein BG004_002276, partial [Podila humilis]